MTTTHVGTNLVPTHRHHEVDAMRLATLHAFREGLRWASDAVNVDTGDEIDVDTAATAIRAFDRAGALLDQLGWEPHEHGIEVDEDDIYLAALAVVALDYDHHEHHFLKPQHAAALDALMTQHMADWPDLTDDQAWSVVFNGYKYEAPEPVADVEHEEPDEQMRVCGNPDCPEGGKPQPWSMFHARLRWPDGTMRKPRSWCKRCMYERDHPRRSS